MGAHKPAEGRPKPHRVQLRDNVQAAARAAGEDAHEGHWTLHHLMIPAQGPGDFTPVYLDGHQEDSQPVWMEWLEIFMGRIPVLEAEPE